MRARVLAAIATLIVAGCGATATPTTNPTPSLVVPRLVASQPAAQPTSAPTPTATPDPEALRKAAAKAYLAAAARYNKTDTALVKKYARYGTLARARASHQADRANVLAFIADMKKITWPPDTAADAHALIARDAAVAALDAEGMVAKTWATVNDVDAAIKKAGRLSSAAANLVRVDLGLPAISY